MKRYNSKMFRKRKIVNLERKMQNLEIILQKLNFIVFSVAYLFSSNWEQAIY